MQKKYVPTKVQYTIINTGGILEPPSLLMLHHKKYKLGLCHKFGCARFLRPRDKEGRQVELGESGAELGIFCILMTRSLNQQTEKSHVPLLVTSKYVAETLCVCKIFRL